MNQTLAAILAIVGGIITVAIIAELVGPKSNAPAAIDASGNFVARVIAAAVDPAALAATNGDPLHNAFSSPSVQGFGLSGLGAITSFPNMGGFSIGVMN